MMDESSSSFVLAPMTDQQAAPPAASEVTKEPERLAEFRMSIHTGMLESLGLNMYSSVAKCLVEFVANGYDADAERVDITIPFEQIAEARQEVRAAAKAEAEAGTRDKFTVLTDPLPESIEVIIFDDGHGMTPKQVQQKFLALNRNRREEDETALTPAKQRYVMGRKGLGKLAGFGAAERITIRTKRRGQHYVTTFAMDYRELKKLSTIEEATFEPEYEDGADPDQQFTEIRLARLRCDSMKYSKETVFDTLQRNFSLLEDEDFDVRLNGELIEQPDIRYDFKYPAESVCGDEGFAEHFVAVDEDLGFPILYRVMFRPRASEAGGQQSLPASHRGARIYCNKRLAKGPSLLNLHSGMHNFHSQSYMECVVHADELDRSEVDHISTNRADFRSDNEVVESLEKEVTELMRLALREHAKHIEKKDDERLERDEFTRNILQLAEHQSKEAKAATRKLLTTLSRHEGLPSDLFRQAASQLVDTMNSSEVLVRLTEIGLHPESIPQLAHDLAELRSIEHRDVLKLYKGRLSAINALGKLYERAISDKGKGFEKELHSLLKENAWLIDVAFSSALTSDQEMGSVTKQLDQVLKIDTALADGKGAESDETRPDLVFLGQLGIDPIQTIFVVELKSPGITLNADHKTQLTGYMAAIKNHLGANLRGARILGFLIGSPPAENASSHKQQSLLYEMKQQGIDSTWKVLSIQEMLGRATKAHLAVSEAISEQEKRLREELS